MQAVPLVILFHEGPIGRAYLEIMRRSGFKPQKIIQLLPSSGTLVRLLPSRFRHTMSAVRNERRANHWPRILAQNFPGLVNEMSNTIERTLEVGSGFLQTLRAGGDLLTYCDDVETLEISDLKDARLQTRLSALPESIVLFTGGGLLPASLFSLSQLRFLHFHPAILPEVRGADGLLWSMLTRGRPGVSSFFMVAGLDAGDLLQTVEFQPLRFHIPAGESPSDIDLYRLLFSLYDPAIRARCLRDVLAAHPDLSQARAAPQDVSVGITYHFMEPRTRHRALATLFS